MEKKITIKDRDELQGVLGLYDRNIKRIRKSTGVTITVRNGSIHIRGDKGNVESAHSMIAQLQETMQGQGKVTEKDIEAVMAPPVDREGEFSPIPGKVFRPREAVIPKSDGQAAYLEAIDDNEIVFSIGPAGTGKTFIAVAKAVETLRAGAVRRIVLVRPAVEAGERLGFLPGDIQAKVNPYLRPIYDSLNAFLEFGQLNRLVESDVIEICPLAFMRGRTLDEAFIILDEAQNTTSDQMKMFLTRMGQKSRIVITGDDTQIDLPQGKVSGLVEVQQLLKGIPGVEFSYLTKEDIVRHSLVQRVVDAYEKQKGRRR